MRSWRKALAVIGVYAYCEIGARITLPGLNRDALAHFLDLHGHTALLSLYDRFVGGAVSRGALLTLGVMPYISARIMVRLLRVLIPIVQTLWEEDPERVNRWTRSLTISLSLIQSFGFSMAVQSIPGVVSNPGYGFTVYTMSVLTAGAIITMELAERLTGHESDEGVASATGEHDERAFAPASTTVLSESTAASLEPVPSRPQQDIIPRERRRSR